MVVSKMRKNIYSHKIELKNLKIKNKPREEFRKLLEEVEYRGYEVENLADGRKIVITKPGGKRVYGMVRREDFMVWIHNPRDSTLWLITHANIYNDLIEKGEENPNDTVKVIDMLEEVYNGKEPDDVLKEIKVDTALPGENPELLLKAYKWIWGQEDCNAPTGKGRAMSWEGWEKREGKFVKTGTGIVDLRNKLSSSLSA